MPEGLFAVKMLSSYPRGIFVDRDGSVRDSNFEVTFRIMEDYMNKLGLAVIEMVLLAGMIFFVSNAINNPSREVTVGLSEYKVNMARQALPANTPITFSFVNSGSIVHEVVLEKAGADDEPIVINGKEIEEEDIQKGETRTVTWELGDSGDYQLACHVPGHFEHGMIQTFKIVPAGSLLLVPLTTWVIVGLGSLLFVGLGIYGLRSRPAVGAPVY
jgi:uncharacterized cupredoxin-like copper-binding protein